MQSVQEVVSIRPVGKDIVYVPKPHLGLAGGSLQGTQQGSYIYDITTTYVYMSTLVLAILLLGVTVLFEEEQYSVEEESGYITLAIVLDGEASVPVTVTVRTLDLLNSSVGDAATGELLEFASS